MYKNKILYNSGIKQSLHFISEYMSSQIKIQLYNMNFLKKKKHGKQCFKNVTTKC